MDFQLPPGVLAICSKQKIKPDTLKPTPLEMPPYDQYQIERDKLKSPTSNNSSN